MHTCVKTDFIKMSVDIVHVNDIQLKIVGQDRLAAANLKTAAEHKNQVTCSSHSY